MPLGQFEQKRGFGHFVILSESMRGSEFESGPIAPVARRRVVQLARQFDQGMWPLFSFSVIVL